MDLGESGGEYGACAPCARRGGAADDARAGWGGGAGGGYATRVAAGAFVLGGAAPALGAPADGDAGYAASACCTPVTETDSV